MGYRKHYKGDPYWTHARYRGKCKKCGDPIQKGDEIFYFPRQRVVFCQVCGMPESQQFEQAAFDEDVFS